jgi:tetratricopeptide (TPR) repeat protein
VDFIHDQGIIDNITYTNTSTRTLFEQYYFAAYGLGIREMIGMMYINSAVDLILTERTQESYAQLEKAFILHPSYKSQYMLLAQLNKFLVNIDYSNPLHLGYLIKASRLVGYGIRWETIEAYLSDIVNTVLVKNEDAEGFRYIYDYLQKYLNDSELKENFRYLYLYESGRIEFNNTRYGKALDYLEPAYELRPGDEKLQDLLARSLGGYSLVVSPGLTLEKIERYDTLYTGLADEGIYRLVKLQTFLALFGEAFQLQDGETGEKYMSEFENLMAVYPEAEVDQILIGRSYSSAAIYYYRDGRIETSEKVIEQGLKYAPDNIELKLKRKAFQ